MSRMIDQHAPGMSPEEAADLARSTRAYKALRAHLLPSFYAAMENQIGELFALVGWHRECNAGCIPGSEHVEYMEGLASDEGEPPPAAVLAAFVWRAFGVEFVAHEPAERRGASGLYGVGAAVSSDGESATVDAFLPGIVRPANTLGFLVRFKCPDPLDDYRRVAFAEYPAPEPPSAAHAC